MRLKRAHGPTLRGVPALAVLAMLCALSPSLMAKPAPLHARMQPVMLDSGVLANPAPTPQPVFGQVIDLGPDVPWVRVLFDKEGTNLPPGSHIRVTSLLDGETQLLDTTELEKWNYGTAFFNGSVIEVELIAGRNSVNNALRIQEVFSGEPVVLGGVAGEADSNNDGLGGIAFVCDRVDTRTLSNEKRVGRLLPGQKRQSHCVGGENDGSPCQKDEDCPEGKCLSSDLGYCTAFIVDTQTGPDKVHLTAGHCFDPHNPVDQNLLKDFVLQFNVPASNANCNINHPPVADQYAVRKDTVIAQFPGPFDKPPGLGNDWGVFKCHPNQETGKTTYEAQGGAFTLKAAPPGVNEEINVEIIGYGVDGNEGGGDGGDPLSCHCEPAEEKGTRNSVQQRSKGTTKRSKEKTVEDVEVVFRTDAETCKGNSGSPVINQANGQVVAIHTGHAPLCDYECGGPGGGRCCPFGICGANLICAGGAADGRPCDVNCAPGVDCVAVGPPAAKDNIGDTAIDHPELREAIDKLAEKKGIEVDRFPESLGEATIITPFGTERITLTGPTKVHVLLPNLGDQDGNGLEEVPTEIVEMQLTGNSTLAGPVTVRVRPAKKAPFKRSTGIIEEQQNNMPGVLDIPPFTETGAAQSFFDVFFEVDVAGMLLHNEEPKRMKTKITHKPPAEDETYEAPGEIPLFDEDGNPTEFALGPASHTPNPSKTPVPALPVWAGLSLACALFLAGVVVIGNRRRNSEA